MFPLNLTESVKAIIGIALLSLVLLSGIKCHSSIKESGREEVRAEWAAEKEATRLMVEELQAKLASQSEQHRKEQREIADEIAATQLLHERSLAELRATYDGRVRNSEARAELYRRQAQGGSTERDHLANHAAQLDRTLEEGRLLVAELRETLGLRDKSLILLGQQITADRELLEETP